MCEPTRGSASLLGQVLDMVVETEIPELAQARLDASRSRRHPAVATAIVT